MAAGRVGATAITPYYDGEQVLLIELAQVLRTENSVSGK